MILELIFFIAAVTCYAISQAVVHGKFNLYPGAFWGIEGWELKYKTDDDGMFIYAPYNWYYRLIGSKYRERWFTSTWLTVAFTDGYHASQALFKIFLCLSFATQIGLIGAGILWVLWGVVFSIVYRFVQR